MEIILMDKVANLGNLGDVVKVKDGFARNYLIPQGMAKRATQSNMAAFAEKKAELERIAAEKLAAAATLANQIEEQAIRVIALHQPVGSDLRRIIGTIRVTIDLERVADLAVNIAETVPELARQPLLKPLIAIPRMMRIAQQMHQSVRVPHRDDRHAVISLGAQQVAVHGHQVGGPVHVYVAQALPVPEDRDRGLGPDAAGQPLADARRSIRPHPPQARQAAVVLNRLSSAAIRQARLFFGREPHESSIRTSRFLRRACACRLTGRCGG